MSNTSRWKGFYKLPLDDRLRELGARTGLTPEGRATLATGGLDLETADHMIENVIGLHALPVGLGLNFQVNGVDYLVPMCTEEPSVVAAASNAARLAREGGGFTATADPPLMIAQVQLLEVADVDGAVARLGTAEPELRALADASVPRLRERGGGVRGLEIRILSRPGDPDGGMLVLHLHVDCRDAMGANLVNTIAEAVADRAAAIAGGVPGLRILSNLADRRLVSVRARVPESALGGAETARSIERASRFAEIDPYRAATHNKGVMNGIDAVGLACGQDVRGIEAGAHAFACHDGSYRPLSRWRCTSDGHLEGELRLPMAVGTVGGALRAHAGARIALGLLAVRSAGELAMVMAAVGLASNLAALRALATEGIQRGHLSLHARAVARDAGACGDLVERVAKELARLRDVNPERAQEVLSALREASGGG
jgi:hydroxymethylglutaryl-CoA reductase